MSKLACLVFASMLLVHAAVVRAEEPPGAPAATSEPPAREDAPRPPVGTEALDSGFGNETWGAPVTGSHLPRADLPLATPLTVYSREQIAASGRLSIGDFLQSLPIHANGSNTNGKGGDGTTRVSLRGLGSHRTLVLLDGRRYPAGGNGAGVSVDLNSVPAMAIERVEILRAGGATMYGSDAVGGVVNLVTRRHWSGAEATAIAGRSSRRDGTLYEVAVTAGAQTGRGSASAAAGFDTSAATWAGDRPWSRDSGVRFFDQVDGVYSGASSTTPQARILQSWAFRGQPIDGATDLYNDLMASCTYPVRSSCPSSYIRDPAASLGWRAFNGAADRYNTAPGYQLTTPQRRLQLFATADYRVGETARFYFEGAYTTRHSEQASAPIGMVTDGIGIVTSADNVYNPFGVDLPAVRRRLVELGNATRIQDAGTYRVVAGVEGTVGDGRAPLSGFAWDVSLNYGRSQAKEKTWPILNYPNLANALGPSYIDATGPHCGTPDSPIVGCVPLNLLGGPGTISQDMIDYITLTGATTGSNSLVAAQVDLRGALFRLASERPTTLALGYELRRVSGELVPDVSTVIASEYSSGRATAGDYAVNEAYAELSLPIAGGMFLLDDLEASASARAFHYDTFGTDYTYALGLRWRVAPEVTLRGAYSTAFRAPSIGEMYLGPYDAYPQVRDPCSDASSPASCGAATHNGDDQPYLRARVGGNPGLRPETANVITLGAVFESTLLEGLVVTADWFDIEITNVVSVLDPAFILASCYPSSSNVVPRYCDLVTRDPVTQRISTLWDLNQNAGSERTSGIDLGVRYALPTARGRLGGSFDATWLRAFDRILPDGTVIHGRGNFDLAGSGDGGVNPEWRLSADLTYALGGLQARVGVRYLGDIRECGDIYEYAPGQWSADYSGAGRCYVSETRVAAGEVPEVLSRDVGAYTLVDVAGSYAFDLGPTVGRITLGLAVSNVFDAAPRRIYNGSMFATDSLAYDFRGRYLSARASYAY